MRYVVSGKALVTVRVEVDAADPDDAVTIASEAWDVDDVDLAVADPEFTDVEPCGD